MKKGFTLIELLAVIVILAIIALIATPIILNIIQDAKQNAYARSVENIIHSSKIFATSMATNNELELDKNIYDKIVDKIDGEVPSSGQVYINKKGEVAFSLKYGEYCYTKSYGEEKYYEEKREECITPFYYLKKASKDVFLDGSILKNEIEKIVTMSTNIVPEDAIGSWDVTSDSKGNVNENVKGKVMAWYKDEDNNNLYEVYIGQEGGVKANPYSRSLFNSLTNVKEMDLSKMDTSNVTDMYEMFYGCSSLTNLDLSSFDTSNVKTMFNMFRGCENLQNLKIGNFKTLKVTNMAGMFMFCSNLINLDVSKFDTSAVENMGHMFFGCHGLTSLIVSNFDTSNVTNMKSMFASCSNLTALDLSNFNTSNVTTMETMFQECKSLTHILVSKNWKTAETNTNMFLYCGTDHVTIIDS